MVLYHFTFKLSIVIMGLRNFVKKRLSKEHAPVDVDFTGEWVGTITDADGNPCEQHGIVRQIPVCEWDEENGRRRSPPSSPTRNPVPSNTNSLANRPESSPAQSPAKSKTESCETSNLQRQSTTTPPTSCETSPPSPNGRVNYPNTLISHQRSGCSTPALHSVQHSSLTSVVAQEQCHGHKSIYADAGEAFADFAHSAYVGDVGSCECAYAVICDTRPLFSAEIELAAYNLVAFWDAHGYLPANFFHTRNSLSGEVPCLCMDRILTRAWMVCSFLHPTPDLQCVISMQLRSIMDVRHLDLQAAGMVLSAIHCPKNEPLQRLMIEAINEAY